MVLRLKTHIKNKSAKATLEYIDNDDKNVVDKIKYLGFTNCETRNIKDFNIHLQNIKKEYQCIKTENEKSNFANHWILSFSDEESQNLDLKKVYMYANEFCEKAFPDNACCFSIHTDTEHTHIHIVQSCYNRNSNTKYRDTKEERKRIFNLSNDLSKERLKIKTLDEYKKEKEMKGIKIEEGTKKYNKYIKAQKEDYKNSFHILEDVLNNSTTLEEFKINCFLNNIEIEQRERRGKISSYIYIIDNKKYTSSKFEKDIFNPDVLKDHFETIQLNKLVEESKKKEIEETMKLNKMIEEEKQRQREENIKELDITNNNRSEKNKMIKEKNTKPINTYIPNNNLPDTLKNLLKVIRYIDEVKERIESDEIKNKLEEYKKEYEDIYLYFLNNMNISNEVALKSFDKVMIYILDYQKQDDVYKNKTRNNYDYMNKLYNSQDFIEEFQEYIKDSKIETDLNLATVNIKDSNKYINELLKMSKENIKEKNTKNYSDYFEK